ncbi:MAG: tRNA (N(6)-L-threonylcarbamoyladenosine(37)-C(2))-methylthiotransferase [archaeon]
MLEIYFETYGCTANYNSTEIMKGLVKQAGLNITSNVDYADLIIMNSCIVKEPTEEKIRRRIQDLLKKNKKIILAGCLPPVNKKIFKNHQGKNLFLLDTSRVRDITNLIYSIKKREYSPERYLLKKKEVKLCLPKIPKEKYIGITQISEGCLGECSYCLTKTAKGKLFSYPKEKILESVKRDVDSGCREIWITSQDNASYGNEGGEYLLPELIREILNLKGNFFVRVGMMNPDNMLKILPELIEIYKNKKIFRFLHIPVQSGSNKILKLMNRKYSVEDFLEIISKFRKEFPEIHISTDFIVGFPEETEEDFNRTYNLLKILKPETININRFWPRPETSASRFENQISPEIIKKRIIKLSKLHHEICLESQKKYISRECEVLASQKGISEFPDTYLARDINYKLFSVNTKEKILGKKLKVKVVRTTPHYLISEIIN